MERYSAFRDPGTGIQPFLTPVAPKSDNPQLAIALSPVSYALGAVRTLLVVVLGLVHALVSALLCAIPIPPTRLLNRLWTALLARLLLLVLGVLWLPVETVNRRRVRGSTSNSWAPRAGDVIVSNWVSIFELLWLAFRCDPLFTIPVVGEDGSGTILGFREASLWGAIMHCGQTPIVGGKYESLEAIRVRSPRPVVVFPECTTSNGRGLLKTADVFGPAASVPVKTHTVYIMAIRYESPTDLQCSLSHSIPTSVNPLGFIFRATSTVLPAQVSIRLLAAQDGPSSPTFVVSEVVSPAAGSGLSEVCSALIASTGKLKRTGQGWEEKVAFLQFYRTKTAKR